VVTRGVEGDGLGAFPLPDEPVAGAVGTTDAAWLPTKDCDPVTPAGVVRRVVRGGRCATTPRAGWSGLTTGGAEAIVAGPRGSSTAMPTARIPAAVAVRGKTAAASCRSNNGINRIVTAAGHVPRP
jgi:hypothetical protein